MKLNAATARSGAVVLRDLSMARPTAGSWTSSLRSVSYANTVTRTLTVWPFFCQHIENSCALPMLGES